MDEVVLNNSVEILIVEDDPVNTLLLKEFLKKYDVNVHWAENASDAIRLYKDNKIDLTFMDIRLPGMDGVECAKQILKINPHAKIIAQTAYAMAHDIQIYLKNGFCDYIVKPLKKEIFMNTLKKWLSNIKIN